MSAYRQLPRLKSESGDIMAFAKAELNGEKKKIYLFKKGDKVKVSYREDSVRGNVLSTSYGGLFVDVDWRNNNDRLGKTWLATDLVLANQ
jgi:hypothetical protein